MLERIDGADAEVYRFPELDNTGFKTFVTGRGGGVSPPPFESLNTGDMVGDDPANVSKNIERIKRAVGVRTIWAPRQVHGDTITLIDKSLPLGDIKADAVVTTVPHIAIGVRTADCLPIILVDPVTKTASAIHAGRRGVELQIAFKTVRFLIDRLSVNPKDIHAAFGPCIRECCYEVDEKTANYFHECCGGGGGRKLSIVSANLDQLEKAGVPTENITDCGICVSCKHEMFYSYRKDGQRTGRFLTCVAIS